MQHKAECLTLSELTKTIDIKDTDKFELDVVVLSPCHEKQETS